MDRKMVDLEELKKHCEERRIYYAQEMDKMLSDEYSCCDFAMCVGAMSAYADMLMNLDEIPF